MLSQYTSPHRAFCRNRTARRAKILLIASSPFWLLDSGHSVDIPLDAAIDQAIEATQIQVLDEAARNESASYRKAASALPNPSLFYHRETLDGSPSVADSRETTFGIAAPLDFIWKRSAHIEAAELRGEVAILQSEERRRQIAREVAMLFADHAANLLERERHESAHVALDRVKDVAQATIEAGDAPPTLMQRVKVAIARHAFEENRIQSELLRIQTHLAALLSDRQEAIPTAEPKIDAPSLKDEYAATQAALEKRPDLKAAKAVYGWKQAETAAAKREGLPDVNLEAGNKEDNAGREGVFLGLSVELPIFDKNRTATAIANAESLRAEVAYAQARRLVEGEARAAFLRWQQLKNNWDALNATKPASEQAAMLLEATAASFEAGEASLLEYLDTVEAYLEAAENEIELHKQLRLAAIELAHATATPIAR